MNINSVTIRLSSGDDYTIPMRSGDVSQAAIKDLLLKHLLTDKKESAVSNRVVPDTESITVRQKVKLKSVAWSKPDTESDVFCGASLSKVLGLPDVYADKKTGKPLPIGSSRRVMHVEVVRFFFESNNRWVTKQALVRTLSGVKKLGLNKSTINSYLCDTVKSGLMQDVSTPSGLKQVRLSPLFINQAKQIGEKI